MAQVPDSLKIGVSLGGGGAKGFAHLPILEVLDELGIQPACISGTSIGAIIGALYASGMSSQEISEEFLAFFPTGKDLLSDIYEKRNIRHFVQLLDFSFKPGSFFRGERILDFLYQKMGRMNFEDLQIPLKVVATDFWRRKELLSERGNLLQAIRASMAIPYVFAPVVNDESVWVDGGLVNNLPYEHLPEDCDLTIAVDVAGEVSTPKDKTPGAFEAIFYTYQVMMDALTQQKLKHVPVDIHVRPPIFDIDMLAFHKAKEVYQQGLKAKEGFRAQLMEKLEGLGNLE